MTVQTLEAPPQVLGLTRRKMSFLEYEQLPSKPKAEWVEGTAIIMMAPAAPTHSRLVGFLLHLFYETFPDLVPLTDAGLRISGSAYRVPDIMLVTQSAFDSLDRVWVTEPPVLVVEVLSPSTWREDLGPKASEYAQAGVQHYWTVDIEEPMITARTNTGNAWRIDAILSAEHPIGEITLGNYGSILLDLNKLPMES